MQELIFTPVIWSINEPLSRPYGFYWTFNGYNIYRDGTLRHRANVNNPHIIEAPRCWQSSCVS